MASRKARTQWELPASLAGAAPLNIPQGTAPSAPVNGDVWTTSAGMYVRIAGVTVGPLAAGGMTNPLTTTGDIIYGVGSTPTRLAGDTSNANRFLRSVSSGGVAAAPTWAALVAGDIPNIAESQVTNLTTDLAAKATDSLVVHLSGTESITGAKTFTSDETDWDSSTSAKPRIRITNRNTDASAGVIQLRHLASDNSLTDGDLLGSIESLGVLTGGGIGQSAHIQFKSDGGNNASAAAGKIVFRTIDSSNTGGDRFSVSSSAASFTVPLTVDSIVATAAGATPALWSAVTTGSIAIGAGLTTGALNLAASGTGATPIAIGHTNSIITMIGTTTHQGQFYVGPGSTQAIRFTGGAGDHGIEIGRTDSVASTPFIDFHAGATGANDYDVRLIASNGGASAGLGTLTLAGRFVTRAADATMAGFNIPQGSAPSSPVHGDMWTTANSPFIRIGSVTMPFGITVSDTAPSSPVTGMLWMDTVGGGTYCYYDSFWVEVGSAGGQLIAPVTITGTAAASIPLTVKAAPSQSTDIVRFTDSSNTVLFNVDQNGGLGSRGLRPQAGTTSIAPLAFASGSKLSSAAQGSVEWDGDSLFVTADTTNGSGRTVNASVQRAYLASAGSAITTGTDFFPSLRPMMKASKLIHFRYQLMFTKNTAGTVTFQLKNSAAANFTFIQATFQLYLQATGALAAVGDIQMGYAAGAATLSFGATKSLTAAANYTAIIEGWCVPASNTRLSVTPSAYGAGTITTIVGSTMWCADYGTYNTNYGNLG